MSPDERPDDWQRFWSYVSEGEIRVPVCSRCGAPNWYPASRCRRCGSAAFGWTALSGEGEVFLAMTVHRDFTGEGRDVPYRIALVEPVEHPSIRLLARVPTADADGADGGVAAGDQVRLTVVDGVPTVGPTGRGEDLGDG